MPANLNGSAKPDDNPKPTIQDQSPERGCGSYSRCVALSGVVLFPPSGFSLSHKRPTQGNTAALFSLVYDTQECAEIPLFFLPI